MVNNYVAKVRKENKVSGVQQLPDNNPSNNFCSQMIFNQACEL